MLLMGATQPVFAQQENTQDTPSPPRIGMVSGTASFWRPGAENWSPAQVNMPLAAGDALYTAAAATLEVQIGPRAYVRMSQNAMLTLLGNEPELQQFKMTSGIAAFDLRSLLAGRSVELDTPSGAFNIDSAGYYRIEITATTTRFIVRRAGEATVTLSDGSSRLIAPSQEAVIEAGNLGNVETYVAPDADAWDEWNYARTDNLIDAISNRYVSPEMYGTDDLDHNGNWRVTPDYGPVWVPDRMAPDWAPYSSGSWVWDPVYAWTWVDTAPWGWAPYHYGRWVNLDGYWAWAPGPRHHHPAYAPALVAFFNADGPAQAGFGGPGVGWVALSWGEPVRPWWGRPGFVGKPWWGGWAGPHVVSNASNMKYRNVSQRNALIAMPERNFGQGRVAGAMHIEPMQLKELTSIPGRHPVLPRAASPAPGVANTVVPAQAIMNQPAVSLHIPPQRVMPRSSEEREVSEPRPGVPEGKFITVRPQAGQSAPWASFGKTVGPERNEPRHPPEPPRIETWSGHAAPSPRQERQMPKPFMQEQRQSAPPPRQQESVHIMNTPQALHRETPPLMPQEAPPAEQIQQGTKGGLRSETPAPLPGQPANQLNPRRFHRDEQSR